jgi:hypothetical protein
VAGFEKIDDANVLAWCHGGRGFYTISDAKKGWL